MVSQFGEETREGDTNAGVIAELFVARAAGHAVHRGDGAVIAQTCNRVRLDG